MLIKLVWFLLVIAVSFFSSVQAPGSIVGESNGLDLELRLKALSPPRSDGSSDSSRTMPGSPGETSSIHPMVWDQSVYDPMLQTQRVPDLSREAFSSDQHGGHGVMDKASPSVPEWDRSRGKEPSPEAGQRLKLLWKTYSDEYLAKPIERPVSLGTFYPERALRFDRRLTDLKRLKTLVLDMDGGVSFYEPEVFTLKRHFHDWKSAVKEFAPDGADIEANSKLKGMAKSDTVRIEMVENLLGRIIPHMVPP